MKLLTCVLVIVLISLHCVARASFFDVEIFIKESSLLFGQSYEEISQKMRLKNKVYRSNQDALIYKASNTGLRAETVCKDIDFSFKGNKLVTVQCNSTEEIVDEVIDRAYKEYSAKGGGVGTGTYFWCVHGRGLEIAVVTPTLNYVAIHESCPPGFIKRYNEDFKRKGY